MANSLNLKSASFRKIHPIHVLFFNKNQQKLACGFHANMNSLRFPKPHTTIPSNPPQHKSLSPQPGKRIRNLLVTFRPTAKKENRANARWSYKALRPEDYEATSGSGLLTSDRGAKNQRTLANARIIPARTRESRKPARA